MAYASEMHPQRHYDAEHGCASVVLPPASRARANSKPTAKDSESAVVPAAAPLLLDEFHLIVSKEMAAYLLSATTWLVGCWRTSLSILCGCSETCSDQYVQILLIFMPASQCSAIAHHSALRRQPDHLAPIRIAEAQIRTVHPAIALRQPRLLMTLDDASC